MTQSGRESRSPPEFGSQESQGAVEQNLADSALAAIDAGMAGHPRPKLLTPFFQATRDGNCALRITQASRWRNSIHPRVECLKGQSAGLQLNSLPTLNAGYFVLCNRDLDFQNRRLFHQANQFPLMPSTL
jgi:hypothetical protein